MIYLHYTGAETPNATQKEPRNSLGGYISNTIVPNATIASLFPDISSYTKNKNATDTICIAIKNVSDGVLKDFSMYCELHTEEIIIDVAVVNPGFDKCGNLFFEKIDTTQHTPYYAEFHNITGVDNKINIGDFNPGEYKAIFIRRFINKNNTASNSCQAIDFEKISADEIYTNLNFLFLWE